MTRERLKEYKHIRQERDKLLQQLDDLETILYGPKRQQHNDMPRGGKDNNRHIVDRKGDEHTRLQKLYRAKVDELETEMLEIEEAIKVLEPRERTLIRLHYFQGLTWEQVAVKMNYYWRHIHRIHAAALEALETKGEKTP